MGERHSGSHVKGPARHDGVTSAKTRNPAKARCIVPRTAAAIERDERRAKYGWELKLLIFYA
jgi:hypothetical protein